MESKQKIILDRAHTIRAEVLENAINVENALTDALGFIYIGAVSTYKLNSFINDILVDITFEKKIKIFKKHVDLIKEAFPTPPTTIKDLDHIRQIRNNIAHRSVKYPWAFCEDDIDENGIDMVTGQVTNWESYCRFSKSGKPDFEFSLQALADYKFLCETTIKGIYNCTVKITSPGR